MDDTQKFRIGLTTSSTRIWFKLGLRYRYRFGWTIMMIQQIKVLFRQSANLQYGDITLTLKTLVEYNAKMHSYWNTEKTCGL